VAVQANGVLKGSGLREHVDVSYLETVEELCGDIARSMSRPRTA